MEHTHTKRYQDCLNLFIEFGGRNLSRIERDMRALGYADFNRRILYSRTERGIRKPGWIERYEWKSKSYAFTREARRQSDNTGDTTAPMNTRETLSPKGVTHTKITPKGVTLTDDFQSWLKSVSPNMTWDWKYQQYIYKHLQRVTDGTCKRLMIFLPPRHGKSELVTVRYAGWRLRQDPKMRIILASYNQKLADKFSRSVRKLLSEEEDRLTPQSTQSSPRQPHESVPGAVATGLLSLKGTQTIAQGKAEGRNPGYDANIDSDPEGVEHSARTIAPLQGADGLASLPEVTLDSLAHPRLLSSSPSATENSSGSASFCQPATWPQCAAEPHGQSQIRNQKSQIPQRMFPKTRTINTVSEWETAAGGGVKAVGVGAGVTGFGAQFIVIDDPVKSRAEAESETFRDKLWDWYNNDLYTRLEPNASMILIQTRWHHDDLAGRLLQEMKDGGDQWDVINLPAMAERKSYAFTRETDAAESASQEASRNETESDTVANVGPTILTPKGVTLTGDPLGRLPGTALCPDRYDETKLAEIRRQLGTYSFSALYQQSPTPADGGIFKREWFKKIVEKAPEGLKWKRGYDLAVSTKTSACYTASFRIAYDDDGNMYIADGFRRRIEFPEQRRYIISRIKDEKDTEHGIEKALHGQALLQDLRREARMRGTYLRGVEATADKLTRALKWAPLAEEGKIILVKGSWNKDFLDEVCLFPSGQFDDQVDAVSMAVAMYGARNRNAWFF